MNALIKQTLLASALCLNSFSALAAETYFMDKSHTEVIFGWNHLGVSLQHGEFTSTSGKLMLDDEKLENSSIEVTIDADSISTGVTDLDGELMGSEFFRVFEFPIIEFQSTSIKITGDETAEVTGDITLRGITKSVVLDTKMTFRGKHPYYSGQWLAFHATTEIDPSAFGIDGGMPGLTSIEINTELKRQ